ncbi:flagellar export chaperone FlgN [bacterium]|nr:flagellar export chaperone FlgN [bacterium]
MSASVIDNLFGQLAEQLELLLSLRDLGLQKQDALVRCRLDQLQGLSEREIQLSGQLAEMEARRLNAIAGVAAEGLFSEGPEPDGETLARLIQRLPLVEQPRFIKLLPEFSAVTRELSRIREHNEALTLNLLDYTGMVMRLLTSDGPASHYGASGVLQERPGRAMLDSRV